MREDMVAGWNSRVGVGGFEEDEEGSCAIEVEVEGVGCSGTGSVGGRLWGTASNEIN